MTLEEKKNEFVALALIIVEASKEMEKIIDTINEKDEKIFQSLLKFDNKYKIIKEFFTLELKKERDHNVRTS